MSRPTTETVNLLPLLDVLLCTMGTLIVVLGVMNRLARFHPTKGNPGKLASIRAQQEELVHAREDLDLRIEQFTMARDKTLSDLDLRRRRLSGIEDHSRQLEDRLRALIDSKRQLQSAGGSNSQREALRSELTVLNARQTELQTQLQKARTGSADRKPAFAIIPFDGLYKTSRRPIYIECRANQVILQPEGIVFTRDDFLGPTGPANPLAAALRAAQEYWRQAPPPAPGVPNEPYPLLLVRPDGIIAYYLAREALSSWDTEFGYELVGADWKLDFPMQVEPRLKDMEIRAVDEARERLQWLAGVSPELFQKQSNKVQYRVSPIRGGVVRDGGPSLGNDPFANDPLGGFGRVDGETNSALGNGVGGGRYASAGGRGGLSPGAGSQGLPEAANGSGNAGGGRTSLGGPEFGTAGPRYAGSGQGNPYAGESGMDRTGGSGQGDHLAGGPQGDRNARGGQGNPQMSHSSQQPLAGTHTGGQSVAEYGGVDLPGGIGIESASSGSDATNALADSRTGSTSPGNSASSAANESTAASGGQPGGSDSGQSSSTGAPSMSYTAQSPQSQQQRAAARSIAENRGRNWALPNSSGASVPIRRPIRIECRSDRLVLMPESRDAQPQVIPLSDRTDDAVDQLVAAVRTHTRSWGIAGRGMYWKPQLVLDVEQAAEGRAQDLQTLLADSGLDVKRK